MMGWRVTGSTECHTEDRYRLLAVIEGAGALVGSASEHRLSRGDVWLVPAACGAHRLVPEAEELRIVLTTDGG
jgi:mannose-6-phosphate isomerase class I